MMRAKRIVFWFVMPVFLSAWGDDLAKRNRASIALLQQQLREQRERIDGLISIIEGQNQTIARLQKRYDNLSHEGRNDALLRRIEALEADMAALRRRLDGEEKNGVVAREHTEGMKQAETASPSKRYAAAVRAYKKRAYDTAKRLFTKLAQEGYKPAASNFYLGEIAYYTKRYEDAIYYYKKSAEINDKAGYMNVLLLHTAVALDKTGKKTQAKTFYETVVENYSDTKAARIAEKRLKDLP
jgi:TolA-binding protein